MAKHAVPKDIEELLKIYKEAEDRLVKKLTSPSVSLSMKEYNQKILFQVQQEIDALNYAVQNTSTNLVGKHYGKAVRAAYESARRQYIGAAETAFNSNAIKLLQENMTGQLTKANNALGRQIQDDIRQATLEATAQKVATGVAKTEYAEILMAKFAERGIMNIMDKNGRKLNIPAYAQMITRTTLAETVNTATINTSARLGANLVKMSEHNACCPLCASLEGRVYSIDGKDKRYPPLETAFSDGFANIHPNCIHRISVYIEKYDNDAEATRKKSNEPYDPNSQKAKDNAAEYKKQQYKKAQATKDKNAWQKAMAEDPENTPKTLSGWKKKHPHKGYTPVKEASAVPKVKTPKQDLTYSKKAKDDAYWFDKKEDADKLLRPDLEKTWEQMSPAERFAAYDYTNGSGGFNRPLRGYECSWGNFKGVGNVDLNYEDKGSGIDLLTSAINKSKSKHDIWIQRGVSTNGAESFLGLSPGQINKLAEDSLKNELLMKVVKDEAFLSCSPAKGGGFTDRVILNLFAPKGTNMIYAEPFSHYAGQNVGGFNWNGKDKQSWFGGEFEIIVQRGSSYRITEVTKDVYGTTYIDLDIIQP